MTPLSICIAYPNIESLNDEIASMCESCRTDKSYSILICQIKQAPKEIHFYISMKNSIYLGLLDDWVPRPVIKPKVDDPWGHRKPPLLPGCRNTVEFLDVSRL